MNVAEKFINKIKQQSKMARTDKEIRTKYSLLEWEPGEIKGEAGLKQNGYKR